MMNNPELAIILVIGTILMCIPITIQMKWYDIAIWKSLFVSVTLVCMGIFGSYIWFFVENGFFGGRSFYGAIYLAPFVFLPVSVLLKIPYGEMMDFIAPAGCLTLALVKIQCMRDRCCEGIVLYVDENHHYVRFPSEIVEMCMFLVIAVILMIIGANSKNRTKIFPWFLILYGASRFVLDFFRAISPVYAIGLSAGSFWSLISFVMGLIWFRVIHLYNVRRSA